MDKNKHKSETQQLKYWHKNVKSEEKIGERDKTMVDKLMYIPNDDIQNYLFCILRLVVET